MTPCKEHGLYIHSDGCEVNDSPGLAQILLEALHVLSVDEVKRVIEEVL